MGGKKEGKLMCPHGLKTSRHAEMNQRRKILGMLVLLSCKSVLRLYPVIRVT
jgi:hypothetical protein